MQISRRAFIARTALTCPALAWTAGEGWAQDLAHNEASVDAPFGLRWAISIADARAMELSLEET
jgi:hypothetical protein